MKLSAIIIARNAKGVIKDCLKSVSWADETLVIDDCSEDKTVEIAKKMGAKVYVHKMKDFGRQREYALKKANGEWVLYVDADERVTASLRDEIKNLVSRVPSGKKILKSKNTKFRPAKFPSGTKKSKIKEKIVVYRIPRRNYYLGNFEWPIVEKIERLFFKKALKGWKGAIHESPVIEGGIGELKNRLLHFTHQDLSSMVKKTNDWSEIEAKMLYNAGHPKMTWWRFLRVMLTKFWQSYILQDGWRISTPGLIESIYQAYSYFIIYTKLWEKQQNESRYL